MRADIETSGHNGRDRRRRYRSATVNCLIILVAFLKHAVAQTSAEVSVPLGGEQLANALQQRRGLVTTGSSLRMVLNDLQAETGIPVIIDRRTDPSSAIQVATGFVTVRESLQAVAKVSNAIPSFGDYCVVIGSPESSGRLRTLVHINRASILKLRGQADRELYTALIKSRDVSWPDLSAPQKLLSESAKELGLRIDNIESVPHDLWAGAVLPEMPFVDFATLVLNQFDLTFNISADGTMTLLPVPDIVEIEQRHRVSVKKKDDIAARWAKLHPTTPINWKGTAAVLTATIELHEELDDLVAGKLPQTVAAAGLLSKRFTLKLPPGKQLGHLVVTLRGQGISIRFEGISDAELQKLLQQPRALDVKQMLAKEFFETAFAELGATITVSDKEVVLSF